MCILIIICILFIFYYLLLIYNKFTNKFIFLSSQKKMELDSDKETNFLLNKLKLSLNKSNNILHKKSLILVERINNLTQNKEELKGLSGLIKYTKIIMSLIEKENFTDDNFDTLIFTLTVCVKNLPNKIITNEDFIKKIINIIKISLNKDDNENIYKYILKLNEALLLSQNKEILSNENNELIVLSNNIYKGFLNMLSQKNNINIKDFLKSICKIINNKGNEIKFSITKNIIYYIKNKINSMYFNNDDENNNNLNNNLYSKISINEGENILKFLSGIIQFLSFDFIKDLLFELKKLIKFSENLIFLTNSFNCFEICLSIFNLDYDFLIELFNDLSNKNIYLISNNNNNINVDYKNLLIISYVKLLAEILKSLNKINKQKEALKKFIYFFSVSIELINENDEFVKNSVYNVFQVLIENFFNKNNLNLLFKENKNNDDLLDIDLNKLNINMDNLNNNNNNNNNENTDSILFKISKIFIYLLNSKLVDKKFEFNILLQFLEKINLNTDLKYKESIQSINDYVLLSISDNNNNNNNENNSNENEYKKIFIGKCFNFIPAELIIQYFPLDLLNYEIEKNDYTENSNVWIISYMSKFLKENVQNLNSFFMCFSQVIFDLEYIIKKLNMSINKKNDEKMEIENIEDEKYEIKENESNYIKELRINRYKLILTQIYLNLYKFGNYFISNNNINYCQYVNQLLSNFKNLLNNNNLNLFTSENKKNEIIFKFIYKVINESLNKKDSNTIMILTNENNLFFFQKNLNLLLNNNNQLQKSTIQILFNVISLYIKIIPLEKISKTISVLLKKFSELLNKDYNFKNMKENNKFLMRIEILNYIILNLNFSINFSLTEKNYNLLLNNNNKSVNEKLIEILLEFFNTFFFNNEIKNKFEKFSYKIFNLFLILLNKITDDIYFNETYNEIYNNQNIINFISPKQKIKFFSLFFKKIKNFEITSKIIINIASLTKDSNIKVRNNSYELIANLTENCIKNKNLFDNFFKIMNSLLISENSFIISSGINCLAKIFWELKDNNNNNKIDFNFLYNNFTIVLSLLKNNNKEITKSIFLYIRVILYLIKNEKMENKNIIINSIITSTLNENAEEYLKEFKVKLRNLYKNLIINYGYENIKKLIPEKYVNFIVYINKNLVKKNYNDFNLNDDNNNYNNENNNDLFIDNDNLVDEEEEYINNQFKKNKKQNNKNKEEKLIDKIESLNIYDDDINEIQKIEKENYKNSNNKNKQKETLDKIEELFKNDNVKLNNFFYVNPFVNNNNNNKNKIKENKNKIKDVTYDINKGKLIIKDIEKEIELKKLNKKKKINNFENNLVEGNLLGKKIKNIHKDNLNLLNKNINDDEDEEEISNKKTKKRKINNKDNKIIYNNDNNKKISTHYVKYSGNEYKNKKGKGDKIIKGEFEPFAYIQLNPKSLNNKGEKGNIKIFENLMKNNNK